MKQVVLLIMGLILCTFTLACAQELSQLSIPFVYDIRMGGHFYYMPKNQVVVHGIDFSGKRSFFPETFVSARTPVFNLTYTHSPEGSYNSGTALLFSKSHRGDIEWVKSGLELPVNPMFTIEWSEMDLYTTKIVEVEVERAGEEGSIKLEKQPQLVLTREKIHKLYGGVGVSLEAPLARHFTLKATGAYKFINQTGWEASAGMCWMPGKMLKGEPRFMLGVSGGESRYDWGMTRNLGLMAEVALTF